MSDSRVETQTGISKYRLSPKFRGKDAKAMAEERRRMIKHARRYSSHVEKIDGRKYRVIRLPDGFRSGE